MRFHLTIMRPDTDRGRFFTQAFHELVETLAFALQALGNEVSYKTNLLVKGAQNIVLGSQFLAAESELIEGTILYNLEQIGGSDMHRIAEELAKRYVIWEYSPINMAYWHEHGIEAQLVPIGYQSQLTRIQPAIHPDIDVLWYGSLNPRRAMILEQLQNTPGLKLVSLLHYGRERDAHIARAKVVLNMHYYDSVQLFEQVRVSYLLSNRKCVVTEHSPDFPPRLAGALCNSLYADLALNCRELVRNVERRLHYEREGFERFSKIREVDILRVALSHLPKSTCPADGAPANVPQ